MQHDPLSRPPASTQIYPAYCFSASPTFNKWVKLTAADVHGLRQEPGFEGQNVYFHLNHPIRYVYLSGVVLDIDFLRGGTTTLLKLDDSSGATIEVKISHPDAAVPQTSLHQGALGRTDPHNKNRYTTQQDSENNHLETDESFFSAPFPVPTTHSSSTIQAPQTHATSVPNLTITTGSLPSLALSSIPLIPGTLLKAKGTLSIYRSAFQLTLLRASPILSLAAEVDVWDEYATFVTNVLCRPWVLKREEVKGLEKKEREREKAERRQRTEMEEGRKARREQRAKMAEKKRRREEREEEKLAKLKEELDGNPLDRVGKAAPQGYAAEERSEGIASAVVHPRVKELGGRPAKVK